MKKKVLKYIFVVVILVGLLLAAHLVVNYFNLSAIMRSIHGG
jgi:hypothetical protein